MASTDNIHIKQFMSYFNIRDSITLSDLFTKIRKDYRRNSIISDCLIDLKPQNWLSGELKTDASNEVEMWAIGHFNIFNINPSETDTNFPACIVEWYIFKNKWVQRTVRTLVIYTNSVGSCKLTWFGV